MSRWLIAFVVLLSALPAAAEDAELAELFARQGVDGTIVVSGLRDATTFTHNAVRAQQRFSTASTFKILNTLISLEEKVVSGKDDTLAWDGRIYEFPDWNHDQTLESAFKVSCVWCFQHFARQVGADKYRHYLREAAYGELREPFDETTFWLDGALQISAVEQIAFLKSLYLRRLPFSASSYETLRQIMRVETTPSYSLWAKTGWATRMKPQVGWYVGYVETPKDVWFFAMNLDVRDEKDLPLRQQLTREALQVKGIIE
ncbi:MAG: OXA-48 family carbapenem-hydrolyzing class D beta-lactamase OXA-54 [Methylomicrobium sp.]